MVFLTLIGGVVVALVMIVGALATGEYLSNRPKSKTPEGE